MENPENTDGLGHLAQLVGEGKKYSSIEELAKGYVHADTYIEALKAKTNDLEQEVNKRMAIEQFIETKQDNEQNANASGDPAPGAEVVETKTEPVVEAEPKVNESELIERIKAELRQDDEKAKGERNQAAVVQRLKDVFGTDENVNKAVAEKAASIGVSIQWMMDTARKSPEAFYGLVGIDSSKKSPGVIPAAVNTAGVPSAADSSKIQQGTKAYYDEIRKTNMKKFMSPEIQKQYMKDAMADPDKFFARNS